MFKQHLIAGLLIGLASSATPVHAQNCATRDLIVGHLETKFDEKLTARGLQTAQSMLEVWVSDESGTFTVILTNPSGVSCIVAAGTNWLTEVVFSEPDGTPS